MCYNKIPIMIEEGSENKNKWITPNFIRNEWEKGKKAQMLVKCGKCLECIKDNSNTWIYKLYMEALNTKDRCMITLTYKDNKQKQLNKKDLQNFIKRLRKNENAKIKYYGVGEYGENKGRPHYHIIILGWKPKDQKFFKISKKGFKLNKSKTVSKLWHNKGIITVQNFHYKQIPYLSLYLNNNLYINNNINEKQLNEKKKQINLIKIKHGLNTVTNYKTKKIQKETKIKLVKDLTPKQLKEYKKDYNNVIPNIKMKKEPEFKIYSKGIGFQNFINNEYYKKELIIDKFKYEIPKEWLIKIINEKKYQDTEIYNHAVYELLKRKEETEKNYHETFKNLKDFKLEESEELKQIRLEENSRRMKNINRKYIKKTELNEL